MPHSTFSTLDFDYGASKLFVLLELGARLRSSTLEPLSTKVVQRTHNPLGIGSSPVGATKYI